MPRGAGTPVQGEISAPGIFVLKLSGNDGGYLMAKTFVGIPSGAGSMRGWAIAASPEGGVFVAGDFRGSVSFGGGSFVSELDSSAFVAAFSPTGEHRWSRCLGPTYSAAGIREAAAVDDGWVVVGSLLDQLWIGHEVLKSAGANDAFVARFAP